jgi:hypothetical protein
MQSLRAAVRGCYKEGVFPIGIPWAENGLGGLRNDVLMQFREVILLDDAQKKVSVSSAYPRGGFRGIIRL